MKRPRTRLPRRPVDKPSHRIVPRPKGAERRHLVMALLARDPRCCWCKTRLTLTTATLEHLKPLSKGGTNEMWNLRLACDPCNQERGTDFRRPQL